MNSLILLNCLSCLMGLIDCHSTHARIGNYSQYIPDYNLCGLSRHSLENKCFKYHQNMFAPMFNARQAINGEAPWVVLVQTIIKKNWPWSDKPYRCTGSLIAPQWVVTAAHCFDFKEKVEVKIFFGTENEQGTPISSDKYLKHPLYNGSDYDIALVHLSNSAQIVKEGEYYSINTICLPPNSIALRPKYSTTGEYVWPEYAFVSGWGDKHNEHLRIAGRIFTSLYKTNRTFYKQFAINSDTMICAGDSGGPNWQYFSGKAVLLGVTRGGMKGSECSNISYGVYVPKFVDWIIESIK